MDSSDREILISINEKTERIESRLTGLENRVASIETRVTALERQGEMLQLQIEHTTDRIEWLQTTVYWGFAIIAFVVAVVPVLRERKTAPDTPHSPMVYFMPAELRPVQPEQPEKN